MSIGLFKTILALGLSVFATVGSGMTQPAGSCEVIGGEKLPAGAGGTSAVCQAFQDAIRIAAPDLAYSAQFTVLSKSALKGVVMANGRKLADQQLSVLDRDLNPSSIGNFTRALAAEAAKTSKT